MSALASVGDPKEIRAPAALPRAGRAYPLRQLGQDVSILLCRSLSYQYGTQAVGAFGQGGPPDSIKPLSDPIASTDSPMARRPYCRRRRREGSPPCRERAGLRLGFVAVGSSAG